MNKVSSLKTFALLSVFGLNALVGHAVDFALNRAFTAIGITNGVVYVNFTSGAEANELFLLYGDEDAGENSAAWDEKMDCGTIAAETTHFEMNLPSEWGETANVLRFAFDVNLGKTTRIANQLEYASFTKKQYVDLGIAFSINKEGAGHSAEFKYSAPGKIDNTIVLGDIEFSGGVSGNGLHFTEWGGYYYFGTGNGEVNSKGKGVAVDPSIAHVVEYVKGIDNEIIIDNFGAYAFGSGNGPSASRLGIGRRGAIQVFDTAAPFDFYYFKCWDGTGRLISDVVPAVNPATQAVEFYDDVSQRFLPPIGDALGAGPLLKSAVYSPLVVDFGRPFVAHCGVVSFKPEGCVVPVEVKSVGRGAETLSVTLAWGGSEGTYPYDFTTNLQVGVHEILIADHAIPGQTMYAKISGVDGTGQATLEDRFSFAVPGDMVGASVNVPRPLTLRGTQDGIELLFPTSRHDRAETLYIFYGPVVGGWSPSEWAHVTPVAEIAPDATNIVISAAEFPDGWGENVMAMRFGLGLDVPLPSRYQEIEYAQFSSGTAVDLGRPSEGECLRFAYEPLEYVNDAHVFGSVSGPSWAHWTEFEGKYYWGFQGSENGGVGSTSIGRHVVEYCRYGDDGKYHYIFDGEDMKKFGLSTSNGKNLMLGRRDSTANFTGRISYFFMDSADGQPVARYYPVYDTQTETVKFFETESQTECEQLSGALSAGPLGKGVSVDASYSSAYVQTFTGGPAVRPLVTAELVGGHLRVSGAIDSLGDNTSVSVRVKYGTQAAEQRSWTEAVVLNASGDVTFDLLDLDPDPQTTYYFALVATGTDNGLTAESLTGHILTPFAATFTIETPVVSAHTVPFAISAQLADVGLGTSEVVAIVNDVVVTEPVSVTSSGPVSVVVDDLDLPLGSAARVKLRVISTVRGISSFSDSLIASFVVKDDVVYTWTGLGDGETWENPGNWTGGAAYPRYLSTARFASGTHARVVLNDNVTLHGLRVEAGTVSGTVTNRTEVALVAGTSDAAIRILSQSARVDGIEADKDAAPLLTRSLLHATLAFDGLAVYDERVGQGFCFYGDGGELAFADGAKYIGENAWIGWSGLGTRLVCDSATIHAKEICPCHQAAKNSGENLVVRGRSDVRANGYARYEMLPGDARWTTDLFFDLRGCETARTVGLFGCLSGATTWPRTDSEKYLDVGGECRMPVRVSVMFSAEDLSACPQGRFKLVDWPDYGLSPSDVIFGALPRPKLDYFYFTDAQGNEYHTAADVQATGVKATSLWVRLRKPGFAVLLY